MSKTTSKQLRFPTISGMSVRAAFDGGAMSSDFGTLLLAAVDRQMGLTDRLAALAAYAHQAASAILMPDEKDTGAAYEAPPLHFTAQTRLIRARPHTFRLNGCRVSSPNGPAVLWLMVFQG